MSYEQLENELVPDARGIRPGTSSNHEPQSAALAIDTLSRPSIPGRPALTQDEFDVLYDTKLPTSPSRSSSQSASDHDSLANVLKPIRHSMRKKFGSLKLTLLWLAGFMPILRWLPAYDWRNSLFGDISGGLTVAVLHIPQGIAYSRLANVDPIVGLYTSTFPPLFYMFLGTSRHCSIGTFAIVALLSGKAVEELQKDFQVSSAEAAAALTFSVGLIILLIYVLQLDFVTNYLSDELVSGFFTGAACHVFVLQLRDFFGIYTKEHFDGQFEVVTRILYTLENLSSTNPVALILSTSCLVSLLLCRHVLEPSLKKRFRLRAPIPMEIVLVIVTTLLSYTLDLKGKYGVHVTGAMPTGLPAPRFPSTTLIWASLWTKAPAVALVALAVHVALAKLVAKQRGYRVDNRQEILALGGVSLASGLLPVFPVCSSLARTIVNGTAGSKTLLFTIFSSLPLLVVVGLGGRLLECLPMCVLAAIIIVALRGMFSEVKQLPTLWRHNKIDCAIWLVACLVTAGYDVGPGMLVSVAFALFTTVARQQWSRLVELSQIKDVGDFQENERNCEKVDNACCFGEAPQTVVIRLESSLLFLTASGLEKKLRGVVKVHQKNRRNELNLVLDCSAVSASDRTGTGEFVDLMLELDAKNVRIWIASARVAVRRDILRVVREKTRSPDAVSDIRSRITPTPADAVILAKSRFPDQDDGRSRSSTVSSELSLP